LHDLKTAETLFHLIPLLEKRFFRTVAQQSKTGLSPMQMHALLLLKEHGACTMSALAGEMLMPKQQVTPIIDKLVKENFVQREYDPVDRRIIRIRLTSSGLDLLEKDKLTKLDVLNSKLAYLDENDLQSLDEAATAFFKLIQKIP
jgi:DNA-binding MarR family transcriptional regulator